MTPKSLVTTLVLILSFSLSANAAERESLKLLTIGNSFARDPLVHLPAMAKAAEKELVFIGLNNGGYSLERHVQGLRKAEAGDPGGDVYKNIPDPLTGGRRLFNLPDALAHMPWDIVTIQQVSHSAFRPETYEPYARELIAAIRKYAPTAEIVLHQTWAYRDDHAIFQTDPAFTPAVMHERTRDTYHKFAEKHDFRILPVGDAFFLARQTPRWIYADDPNFDYENPPAEKDTRPNQPTSLFIGWRWTHDKLLGEDVFLLDAIHLNDPGRYLATCVWYLELFGAAEIPAGTFDKVLDPETTADLRHHALTAVQAHRASHQPVATTH